MPAFLEALQQCPGEACEMRGLKTAVDSLWGTKIQFWHIPASLTTGQLTWTISLATSSTHKCKHNLLLLNQTTDSHLLSE